MKGFLRPSRGEQYHLLDFRRVTYGKEEVFNHAHSPLLIERTFSVLKKTDHF